MRMVFGLVLLIGVALAGGAVYLARGYISEHQNALAEQRAQNIELTQIIVAKEPLRYGEQIELSDVSLVKWPVVALPEGAFQAPEELFSRGENELRVVLRAMEKGEPILAVKVTEPGQNAGLTSTLTKGMRAFTINVDVSTGVSGFLRPGDTVDVYWTGRQFNGNRNGGDVTKLIDTRLKIIAIDQQASGDLDGPQVARTITVEVRPQQVAKLAHAQNSGRLSLALVGAEDDTVANVNDVDQRALLGVVEEVAAEVEQEEVCTIRTRRGAEVVEIPIPCTN